MQFKLILSGALAFVAVAAHSQELRPLSEYQKLPLDRQDEAYPYVRCVGLFQGFFRYGGANMSEEDTARAQMGNEAMGLVALLFRQQKNQNFSLDDITTQLRKEIEEVTQIYLDRMTRNYNLTGEAFGSDAVVSGDLEICGGIAQDALTAIQSYSTEN